MRALRCQSEALGVCFHKAGWHPQGRGGKKDKQNNFYKGQKAHPPPPAPSDPLPCTKPFRGAPRCWGSAGLTARLSGPQPSAEAVLGRAPHESAHGYVWKPPPPVRRAETSAAPAPRLRAPCGGPLLLSSTSLRVRGPPEPHARQRKSSLSISAHVVLTSLGISGREFTPVTVLAY